MNLTNKSVIPSEVEESRILSFITDLVLVPAVALVAGGALLAVLYAILAIGKLAGF
jgi:hypothetical protein